MATWRQRLQEFGSSIRLRDESNSDIPGLRPRRQFCLSPLLTTRLQRPPEPEPLISVILPVYNHQRFLAEAVYSVLTQSHNNLELIVIDDGSEEDITSTLQSFLKDPRMQLFRQNHLGLSAALNNGFSRAQGVFYSWTSADNCYLPNALQAMSLFLLANPTIDLTYANVDLINEDGTPCIGGHYRPEDQLLAGSPRLFLPLSAEALLERADNFINACFLYRREVALRVGPYDERTPGYEDYDYWIQIALCSSLGSGLSNSHLSWSQGRGPNISHLDDDLSYYQYRLHDNTLTKNLNQERLATAGKELVRAAREVRGCSPREITISSALPPTSKELSLLREAAYFIGSTIGSATLPSLSKATSDELSLAGAALPTAPVPGELFRLQLLSKDPSTLTAENQILLRGFRPDIFDRPISYTHSSHLTFHGDYAIRPFLLLAPSSTVGETPKQVLVLPPLIVPQILRRARESFFGAIQKEPQSKATVLLFMPDFVPGYESRKTRQQVNFVTHLELTASLISTLPKITFALLALTETQRQTADKIHTLSNYKRNVRIIDLSDRPFRRMDSNDTLEPDGLAQALMYVLSSVDLILSLRNHPLDFLTMLELRIESALGAAAGLRVLAVLKLTNKQTSTPLHEDPSQPQAEGSQHDPSGTLLWSFISSSPALERIYLESHLSESNPSHVVQIEKRVLALTLETEALDQRSAEQWLQQAELARIGENIAALFRLAGYEALKRSK